MRFMPLESNPAVFNELIQKLGVKPSSVEFSDVWSLDPDMLAFVARPSYALLLVFPVSETYEKYRETSDHTYDPQANGYDKVYWFPQTIGNACGTYALIHAALNGLPKDFIEPHSFLDGVRSNLDPSQATAEQRAQLLEQSTELAQSHGEVAAKGDSKTIGAEEQVDFHYVCLVKASDSNTLYELDGRRKGPIVVDNIGQGDDVLTEAGLKKVQEFLDREGNSGQFSILTLGPKQH